MSSIHSVSKLLLSNPVITTPISKTNSRRYLNQILQNLSPEDQQRAQDYVHHMQVAQASMEETPAPPAQEVADIVLELAQTPAGQRPLRQVAMPPEIAEGTNQLNATLEQVQSDILTSNRSG